MIDTAPAGHVKLARKMFDPEHGHVFWLEPREFSRFEAWIDVIQLAAFAPYTYHTTHFGAIELARGEFVASLRWLGARWRWTVKRVRTWLATCEKWAQLKAQRETPAGTVYAIVNYDTYQSQGHSKGTATTTPEGTAGAQQGHKRKASKASTTSLAPDVERVFAHHIARHPHAKLGEQTVAAIDRALARGYSPDDLCRAIDGCASDRWCVDNNRFALTYVFSEAKLDEFIAKGRPVRLVDEFGILTPEGAARIAS